MQTDTRELQFAVDHAGAVSALLDRPPDARVLLVLAHGAGAGMHHAFMESLAAELAGAGIATLRYQFPYMERRRPLPDPPRVLTATVRAAVKLAGSEAPELVLLAGGKSLGGRMTSLAAAEAPLDGVRGLVFFGFPLHPPRQPGTKRADHLAQVTMPMLFLQGTRDPLAEPALLRPLLKGLGPSVTLHLIEGADHSFHVPQRSGKTDAGVLQEVARTLAAWAARLSAK